MNVPHVGQNCSSPVTVAPQLGHTCLAMVSFRSGERDLRPPLRPVLCHVVAQSQIITAEPWTPVSIVMGLLLLAAVIAAIVWVTLRRGGQ